MATRGYHQYRGRGRSGKPFLVILLLLILLCACAFLLLQRYLVYHDDGSISLALPFFQQDDRGEQSTIPDDQVDISREEAPAQPPADPQPQLLQTLHAVELPYNCLYSDPAELLQGQEAIVVNIKRIDGTIAYRTDIDLPENVLCGNEQTRTNVQAIAQSSCYTVARISALCDNAYPLAVPASAITAGSGGQWSDDYGRFWLDPSREETVEYLCALAKECADLGFDEILLDQLRYPIEGNLEQSTLDSTADRSAIIAALADQVRQSVGDRVAVSILLPAGMGSDATFLRSGLSAQTLIEHFDRIYVPEGSWAYFWLDETLSADYERSIRLVLTASYAAAESYMITQ